MRSRLLWTYYGRDYVRGRDWIAAAALIPRPDLMRASEDGRVILCGLSVEFRLRWPWGPRDGWCWAWDRDGWRWPVRATLYSDAPEIASRLAMGAAHG